MKLTPYEIRATVYVLRLFQQTATQVPPSVAALAERLETAVRQGDASPWRQSEQPSPTESEHDVELISTAEAAHILGWTMRRVQRHAADLDGRRLGDRLAYPADRVHEYRDALTDKEQLDA